MTYQRGNEVAAAQTYCRSKTWCNLYAITRKDGTELRFTDHSRKLTVDGKVYLPIGGASVSNERRESGLKTGSVEAVGLHNVPETYALEGTSTGSNTTITLNDTTQNWAPNAWRGYVVKDLTNTQQKVILSNTATQLLVSSAWSITPTTASYAIVQEQVSFADLIRGIYRDATVSVMTIDWRKPWRKHYGGVRFMRDVRSDGAQWTVALDSRAQQIQKPQGGPRGGVFTPTCPYKLGDKSTCKANITADIQLGSIGTQTLTDATPLTLTVGTASYTVNAYAGYRVVITSGAAVGDERIVVSNTATVLTLDRALSADPVATDTFELGRGLQVTSVTDNRKTFAISTMTEKFDGYFRDGEIEWMVGDNKGVTSPIYDYTASTRTITLLIPTPYPITTSDFGIVRPGCDGLVSTCRDKFNNVANFGGSPYDPGSGFVLSTPGNG